MAWVPSIDKNFKPFIGNGDVSIWKISKKTIGLQALTTFDIWGKKAYEEIKSLFKTFKDISD